jgi:hypothetical protein
MMKNTPLSRVQKIIYAIGLVSMVVAMIVIMAGCDGAGGLPVVQRLALSGGPDLGAVELGHQGAPVPFAVTNTGGEPTKIAVINVENTTQSLFPLAYDGCTGTTLQPGESCVFDMTLLPIDCTPFPAGALADVAVPSETVVNEAFVVASTPITGKVVCPSARIAP